MLMAEWVEGRKEASAWMELIGELVYRFCSQLAAYSFPVVGSAKSWESFILLSEVSYTALFGYPRTCETIPDTQLRVPSTWT